MILKDFILSSFFDRILDVFDINYFPNYFPGNKY